MSVFRTVVLKKQSKLKGSIFCICPEKAKLSSYEQITQYFTSQLIIGKCNTSTRLLVTDKTVHCMSKLDKIRGFHMKYHIHIWH
jgi:hypothetical protein